MRSAEQDSFVQHAADVAVAGHAAGTGSADLRDAADGLRVVLGDRFANFALGDVQTMTDRPMRFGVNVILGESLLTEVHGRHSTERGTGATRKVDVEIESQLWRGFLSVSSAMSMVPVSKKHRTTPNQQQDGPRKFPAGTRLTT